MRVLQRLGALLPCAFPPKTTAQQQGFPTLLATLHRNWTQHPAESERWTAQRAADFLLRDLRLPQGVFATAIAGRMGGRATLQLPTLTDAQRNRLALRVQACNATTCLAPSASPIAAPAPSPPQPSPRVGRE